MAKLDILVDFVAGGVSATIQLSGAPNRNGKYYAFYYPDAKHAAMGNHSPMQFPLKMSWDCISVSEFVESITNYFERHGCLL